MKTWTFWLVAAPLLLAAASPAAQRSAELPPISWTCPMHPEVLEDKKGGCHICRMDLEPIRLALVYTCPVHAVIEEGAPGKCRICARELVQKTAALTFTCRSNREIAALEPGRCPDGSAMVPRYTARAHGDHNPKHGGIFFMAPDNWHHLEGTYPSAGRFRVYVYDDFSRPLTRAQLRNVRGRVVTSETFDPKTGITREDSSKPLVLARNGAYFEARIDPLSLPAKMTAKMTFGANAKESRFDFTFPAYSRDLPAAAGNAAVAAAAPAPAPRPIVPADGPGPNLLADLKARQAELEALVKEGSLGAVYVPALQAKDLALAIQAGRTGADADALEVSVRQIVLAAYELDSYGDLGDGEKVHEAYGRFSAAVAQLDSLVSAP